MSKIEKIIYGFLFLVLILHPHLAVGHIFDISTQYAQSFINFSIILIAGSVYLLHAREIKRKEKEKQRIKNKLNLSSEKLIDSFKYIGKINRRLQLIQGLTTDLIFDSDSSKKSKKDIFNNLLNTATVSIAKVDWGIFRFLNIKNQNTIKEFVFTKKRQPLLKIQISNKELLSLFKKNDRIKASDDLNIIITSDHKSEIRCFMLLPKSNLTEADESVLQAIVDQTQLFYQYLYSH